MSISHSIVSFLSCKPSEIKMLEKLNKASNLIVHSWVNSSSEYDDMPELENVEKKSGEDIPVPKLTIPLLDDTTVSYSMLDHRLSSIINDPDTSREYVLSLDRMKQFCKYLPFNRRMDMFRFDESGLPRDGCSIYHLIDDAEDIWNYVHTFDPFDLNKSVYLRFIIARWEMKEIPYCAAILEIENKCQRKDKQCKKDHFTGVMTCRHRHMQDKIYCKAHQSFSVHSLSKCTKNRIKQLEKQASEYLTRYSRKLTNEINAEIVKKARVLDINDVDDIIASYLTK